MNDAAGNRVNWGVLGSAWINNLAIPGLLSAGNARLLAVSSGRPEVAEGDRQRWGAERAYSSYQALLDDREIDAVYVPLPNHLHATWVVTALQAGKHVLCEKPLALSLAEVDGIARAAERSGKLVMEAFMYRFAPRWRRAMELIRSGAIGDARLARVTLGFKQFYDGYNIRFDPEAGGGALWDMGCYAVNMSRLIFAAEPRRAFATRWSRPGEKVDTTTSGVLDFEGGRSSIFSVSFDFINPLAQVEIVGTDGWISMQGTGMRGEPFTRLLRHRFGEEVFLGGVEPAVESFAAADSFAAEFHELGRAIIDGDQPQYGLADARENTRVILALADAATTGAGVEVRQSS
jgi:D-xylose 1-dehydrogenase (NADP+, D-xylono-1,5-lactone-forming)